MTIAEPVLGLAALFAALLNPAQPSEDMQHYIDRGLIDGAETGPWSVMLWDALRRHDIAPLWERPQYCGRHAYDALSALIRGESNFDNTDDLHEHRRLARLRPGHDQLRAAAGARLSVSSRTPPGTQSTISFGTSSAG